MNYGSIDFSAGFYGMLFLACYILCCFFIIFVVGVIVEILKCRHANKKINRIAEIERAKDAIFKKKIYDSTHEFWGMTVKDFRKKYKG
jgi:uncharacterized membrane protein